MAPEQAMTADYAAAVLQWYLDNGVDETMGYAPVDRLAAQALVAHTPRGAVMENKNGALFRLPHLLSLLLMLLRLLLP